MSQWLVEKEEVKQVTYLCNISHIDVYGILTWVCNTFLTLKLMREENIGDKLKKIVNSAEDILQNWANSTYIKCISQTRLHIMKISCLCLRPVSTIMEINVIFKALFVYALNFICFVVYISSILC